MDSRHHRQCSFQPVEHELLALVVAFQVVCCEDAVPCLGSLDYPVIKKNESLINRFSKEPIQPHTHTERERPIPESFEQTPPGYCRSV